MGIFSRRSTSARSASTGQPTAESTEVPQPEESQPAEKASGFDRSSGPFDVSESPGGEGHLDLGSLRVAGVEGMQLRLEIDQEQQQVVGATVVLADSSLQLQAFAAPRSGGLWSEIRDEIASSVVSRGGTAETAPGPLGPELRTRMPSQDGNGRTVFAPARFLGVDGPRWFLRGVLTGRSAIDDAAAGELLDLFRSTIVVRGSDPMAPRELLPLSLPQSAPEPAAGDTAADRDDTLNPFERGPEITEVR
ncbi:MAG: DUF3710 domain-containing protein [Actinobacteria bacterium]|nr:DUF3710 domain-containing protein [Actinomycetota bacterium]